MTEGTDRVVDVAGRKVGYALYGDPEGFPVLALHGTPASRLMYRRGDAPARRLHLKLIAPDRPGYGLSPPDAGATLASRTELNIAFAGALGLDRFALVGVSGGAPFATALASRLGARVSALALVSPMGPIADYVAEGRSRLPLLQRRFFLKLSQRGWLVKPGSAVAMAAFRRAPHAFASLFARALRSDDTRLLSDPDVRASLIAMTEEALRTGTRGALADFAIFGRPWQIDFSAITGPSALWIGSADTVVPVPVAVDLAHKIPGCRVIRLPGAAHFWVMEHASDVLSEVRAMMDQASSR